MFSQIYKITFIKANLLEKITFIKVNIVERWPKLDIHLTAGKWQREIVLL